MEIRRSYDRLIPTMLFPMLVRYHLYIEPGPWSWQFWCFGWNTAWEIGHCHALDRYGRTSSQFEWICKYFHSGKCNWKHCLQNGDHLGQTLFIDNCFNGKKSLRFYSRRPILHHLTIVRRQIRVNLLHRGSVTQRLRGFRCCARKRYMC